MTKPQPKYSWQDPSHPWYRAPEARIRETVIRYRWPDGSLKDKPPPPVQVVTDEMTISANLVPFDAEADRLEELAELSADAVLMKAGGQNLFDLGTE